MTARDWWDLAGGSVAYVLGIGGGYFLLAVPSQHPLQAAGESFALGFASAALFFLFLFIVALVRWLGRTVRSGYWLVLSAGLFIGFIVVTWQYESFKRAHSYPYLVEDSIVVFTAGTTLTPQAKRVFEQDPHLSKAELVSLFGGPDEAAQVWMADSIDSAQVRMDVGFVLALIAFASALFFLTEGVLPRVFTKPSGNPPEKEPDNPQVDVTANPELPSG